MGKNWDGGVPEGGYKGGWVWMEDMHTRGTHIA
jgi:hypothetical protein